MKNTMNDLRNHLFETLEALKDEEKPMEIDRALAVANVADKIIETAKVEVQFLKVTGASDDGAFASPARPQLTQKASQRIGVYDKRKQEGRPHGV